MSNFDLILFDLDGTLTDPGEGITNSVAYALKKYGIETKDKTELYKFIGPPLVDSFKKYYSFSDEQALEAVEFYREYFKPKGMLENTVYDGIEKLLKELKNSGKRLCVATSKPEEFAKTILNHFGLAKYFDFICGATMDSSRSKKADVIEYALKKCQVSDKSKVIMVGDKEHDVFGARQCGIKSIGVLFGYGTREELESAGADFIAEDPEDITVILQ